MVSWATIEIDYSISKNTCTCTFKKIHGYAKSIILIKHNLVKIVNEMALGVSDKRYLILLIFGI